MKVKMNKRSQKLEDIDKQILNCFMLLKAREFDKVLSIVNNILNKKATEISLTQKFGALIARLITLMALKKYNRVKEEIELSEQIIDQMNNVDKEDVSRVPPPCYNPAVRTQCKSS